MSHTKYQVFISFSQDQRDFAERLSNILAEEGLSVWFAPRSIQVGDMWSEAIAEAAASAQFLVLVWSEGAARSTYVRTEYLEAIDNNRVIIPIVTDATPLPSVISRNYQAIFMDGTSSLDRSEFYQKIGEIIEGIQTHLQLTVPSAAPEHQAAESSADAEKREVSELLQTSGTRIESAPISEELAQIPHFSTFYPDAVQPNHSYTLMAFVHLESASEQVREIASGYASMMGGKPQSDTAASRIVVDMGKLITFVPDVSGVHFDPPCQVVTWQPPHQSAMFLFTTSADLSVDLTGRVMVYQGPLVIGEIPVHMKLLASEIPASVELATQGHMDRFDPIFASYSHRDMPVMEYFRRARATVGQRMLIDIYELRAGEHWADRLLEMIEQSAVFQLFWSPHSAKSSYCRQEWEHALKIGETRPRFIQPVWWNEPMVSPPPELANLHFQRVRIPPLTQAQLAVARVRGWFRRV